LLVAISGRYQPSMAIVPEPPVASEPAPQPDTALAFRDAMRGHAASVAMITTWVDGRPWGVTVTAVCSLSVQPPRLLVSLMRHTVCCRAIVAQGSFGVSLLSGGQEAVALRGAHPGQPKFLDPAALSAADAHDVTSPVIAGALSHLQCRLVDVHDGGDHEIIVGQVTAVIGGQGPSRSPLVYHDGGFRHLATTA
jgi:flavin reductase (DIM6/NTAB) family NADH-FMN oxidoreductase RutF